MVDIARVVSIFSGLLREHRQALEIKHIRDERSLRKILCCDYEKMLHALVEVKTAKVDQVLFQEFFNDEPALAQEIFGRIRDPRFNHVGYEVLEPLDLVVKGIEYWVDNLNQNLGSRIRLKKYLRFPASQNFQKRVNAYTEILCVWLQVDEQVLVLELFDISHDVEAVLPPDSDVLYHINPHKLLSGDWVSRQHLDGMKHLFVNDSIWHYSVLLDKREDVEILHERIRPMTEHNRRYKLAYERPVENKHDGSFHTKVINLDNRLELELCHLIPVG